ncbi:hypothetical protein EG856_01390 [Mycoplasmopsis phocirhinis]|uniref:site-specific DNA-methyltransferase (adenine-specific) n=1 Tax=Mycoplasmopsis phocirhinis TaxID=142650 RepID=A0A4P6MPC5_9BACT|nr:methyltransferase [Mycoplasmopsis phocirhinis]QBF34576.1 hypothetical protein EG856_01390 [Mycoplasmopsis phocirhinis]
MKDLLINKTISRQTDSLTLLFDLFNNLNHTTQVSNRDDIPTPMECVKRMLDYIPEDFWKNKNIKVLDPCCGYGNFGAYCQTKTYLNNIYFNELDRARFQKCQKLLNPKHISNDDAFKIFNSGAKFDLIMANPPYSGGGNKNQSLSNKFIEASIDSLNNEGYICFITPNNWMSFNNNNTTLKKLLAEGEFVVIDNDCKKYFPTVGSSFTILIWKKTKIPQFTLVKNNFLIKDEQIVKIPKNLPFIPLYLSQEIISIIQKSFSEQRNLFKYRCDLHNYTKKNNLSDNKDNIFKYETIHTVRKTRYANIKQDIYEKWIIIFPLSTYFIPFIEHHKNTTQSVGYMAFDTQKQAQDFLPHLKEDYIKVLIHITRYGNFNCVKVLKHIIFDQPKFNDKELQVLKLLRSKIKY